MARRFFVHEELFDEQAPPYASGERRLAAMPLHIPCPLQLLVTLDPRTHEPRVTTATLGPLSWSPLTLSANVPLTDTATIRHLQAAGECVLALPPRELAPQLMIMSHPLPSGICAADVARLTLISSQRVEAPSIQECTVNLECIIEYYVAHHRYGFVSLRVLGATIDGEALEWPTREEAMQRYPINYLGEAANADGTVTTKLGMMGTVASCPTFPVGHKQGWNPRIRSWARDLADEGYISPEARDRVTAWVERYERLRLDAALPERQVLRERLATFAEHAAWQEWDALNAFMAQPGEGASS